MRRKNENSCESERKFVDDEDDDEQNNRGNFVFGKKVYSASLRKYDSVNEDNRNGISDSRAASSSCDESGPSFSLPPTIYENPQARGNETAIVAASTAIPSDDRPHVRIVEDPPERTETRRDSVGPPPSYSFVMKQKKKDPKMPPLSPCEMVTDRPPPPTYAGLRGLYSPSESEAMDRMCVLPSFQEPIWRSHSQPAFCPRCGIFVLTTTHSHESVATHVAALVLCLLGCWPCCFLPYCMNVCKNTYHHCPICQAYLGSYTPW